MFVFVWLASNHCLPEIQRICNIFFLPKINWEVELDCGTAKGSISYPDFGYDGKKAHMRKHDGRKNINSKFT